MIPILKYGEVPNDALFCRELPASGLEETVAEIIRRVREKGDAALREYSARFDGVELDALEVSPAEIEAALAQVDPALLTVMEQAAENIRSFHQHQVRTS